MQNYSLLYIIGDARQTYSQGAGRQKKNAYHADRRRVQIK